MLLRWAYCWLFFSSFAIAEWKPAPSKLMTKWGSQLEPNDVWQEYPRPQLVRSQWENLNGLWDYAITTKEAKKPAKWDGQILVPFCVESALSGVGKTINENQVIWYRRSFKTPKLDGKRLLLHFGAVDWQTTVYINNKTFNHEGGYDPFSFDVTDALSTAEQQELIVRVWDPTDAGSQPVGKQIRNPHGIWYTPVSGIWQTVWTELVPTTSITAIYPVANIDDQSVTITLIGNNIQATDQFTVSVHTPEPIVQSGSASRPLKINIPKPNIWTPSNPHLYGLTVKLIRQNAVIDTADSYFAMRKISVGADSKGTQRMMLNNRPLFQYGPLDQGWWPDGLYTPPSVTAMVYDLKVLKDLGMNMLRKHIKVEPAIYYRKCDEMGLLVWQDMPCIINRRKKHFVAPDSKADAEFTAEEKITFRKELQAMMEHLRFFPSIVVWVPFNEGWGQHDTNAILKWTMEQDPTRLVDGPSGWADRGFGHLKDMHQYPGPGMFPVMADRVSVLGEFGGLGLPLTKHLWKNSDNWGYQTFKTQEELQSNYNNLMLQLLPLIDRGLSAAVYTQTTDVEIEVNGLMTYDRSVLKVNQIETAKWHQRLFAEDMPLKPILDTSELKGQEWRYVLESPADAWKNSAFDDRNWKTGIGGFGTRITPNTTVNTEWNGKAIWLRRQFEMATVPEGDLYFRIHHDEDTEIYINGVLAGSLKGYTANYRLVSINELGKKALLKGKNTIAVSCKQTIGGQYIDVGIIEMKSGK